MPKKAQPLKQNWKPERQAQARRKADNSKFYNSRAWRKHRATYLKKFPLCVHCLEESKTESAKVLDHILRIENGGDKWDYKNLQGLCTHHHAKKSGREAHDRKKGEGGANL